MPDQALDKILREQWDDLLMTMLYKENMGGERLLTEIVNQANDSMARLKERGILILIRNDEDEDED